MMVARTRADTVENMTVDGTKEEFLRIFKSLCGHRSEWQVWEDVITMIACSISVAVDEHKSEERERKYMEKAKHYADLEPFCRLYANIIEAFERNPDQDYLGELYQDLKMSSHWKGQFFTPFNICRMMAKMTLGERIGEIEEKGFITINDPACGAGATLIAAASEFRSREDVNYQRQVWFVGLDVDPIVAMMCYIQLSFLGCPGYICVTDTLCNPITGADPLLPNEQEGQDLWFMPLTSSDVWVWRRKAHLMDSFLRRSFSAQNEAEQQRVARTIEFSVKEDGDSQLSFDL